ncbi:MAG TPA: phenylalanine--tRNA ligase beta subunit-related protein [Draconibacterium sp.]|nr:phenylalanine--tRNA ligase beta subunit-related protein [Draconibacterium sp.]
MNYTISTQLAQKVPDLELACIECNVEVQAINVQLWDEIQQKTVELSAKLKIEDIKDLPAISASRLAYKACGKDPARYRLSAEALLRRVVNRNEIYQISNVVDLLNLVSISTGFSIGGYDADKIEGDIIYGIGKPNEPYTGIGRGELNIEGMPVFRDSVGAFGTPTSDSERTSVTLETKRFLMIIIDYAASPQLAEATALARELLVKYAQATNFDIKNITNYP